MGKGDMQITIIKKEKYVHCVTGGSMLISSYKKMYDCIKNIISENLQHKMFLVLDFSKIDIVSSTCINIITSLRQDIMASDFELIIISPENDSKELFEITGLSNIYHIYATLNDFLKEKSL